MTRTKVSSSNVDSVGWAKNILEVEFKGGGIYHYAGVPEPVFEQVLAAKSVGAFLNSSIKPNYAATKQ